MRFIINKYIIINYTIIIENDIMILFHSNLTLYNDIATFLCMYVYNTYILNTNVVYVFLRYKTF